MKRVAKLYGKFAPDHAKRSVKISGRSCILGFLALLGFALALARPAMAQGIESVGIPLSVVFTSTTSLLGGVAIPGETAQPGADEQLDLSVRARIASLRLSALVSGSVSAGFGATARWYTYSAAQTLRWSWPEWSAASSDGGGSGGGAAIAAPDFLAALEVKELAAAVSGELAGLGFKAELGKFPLKWGVGKAFRPSDIFKTMDYSALIPQTGGTPAARLSVFPSALSKIEAAVAVDGQGAIAAGARYLMSISNSGVFAASAGWRRTSNATEELSASIESQLDVGIFSPYTEISAHYSAKKYYLYTMFGTGAMFRNLTLSIEGQGTLGLSTPDLRFFFLATWAPSELTSISFPFFWFNDAQTASGGILAQLEGIFGGRLSFSASSALFCAYSSLKTIWNLSAAWTRSLSTY